MNTLKAVVGQHLIDLGYDVHSDPDATSYSQLYIHSPTGLNIIAVHLKWHGRADREESVVVYNTMTSDPFTHLNIEDPDFFTKLVDNIEKMLIHAWP